jgi:Helix-turn-helix domain
MKTLTLKEAAEFLKMHPEEVRSRAKLGLIPGAKAGRRWILSKTISPPMCARYILSNGKRLQVT